MIGPVSTTGRTMMTSLQQAMSKGMPVDQAIAYVKSMARDGVAPLVDLYALLKQFERMKQVPTQQLQTPNIMQQVNGLAAMQNQAPPPRQAAPMPEQAMGMAMGGLASLDAGRMENPSFAGGGIVAFDSGGTANTTAPQMYSDIPKFDTYEQMRAANLARLGQDPTTFEETEAERIRKANQARGLGEFAPSMTLREKLLAEDKAAAERTAAEESALDTDEYWGDVASNAAERGATLLTSLAKAQKGRASRKRATAEKVKKATRDAKVAEIAMQQVKELEKAGRYKEAAELRKSIHDKIETASGKIADAAQDEAKAKSAQKRAIELKQTRGAPDAEETIRRRMENLDPDSDEFAKLEKKLEGMRSTPGKIPTQFMNQLRDAQTNLRNAQKAAVDIQGNPIPNDPRVVAAQQALNRVQQDIIANGYSLPGVTPAGGASAPSGLQIGTVQEGYRYKGGDPANPNSWEPVE